MRSRFRKRLWNFVRESPLKSFFYLIVCFVVCNIVVHWTLFSNMYRASSVRPHGLHAITRAANSATDDNATSVNDDLWNATIYPPPRVNYSIYVPQPEGLSLCPDPPVTLKGPLAVNAYTPSWEALAADQPLVFGGLWRPQNCRARDSVAIVVPYRNRSVHLRKLLYHLHPILQRQELDYGFFVVDQVPGSRFNRALLFNIGFLEAMKVANFSCFIFHDVDLLPEDDRNLYRCGLNPRHMSVSVDKFRYRLPYADLFGGVSALTRDQFLHVNGFSNLFFGWGGEDDDMSNRVRRHGFKITRYPAHIARYRMIKHEKDSGNKENPMRHRLISEGPRRWSTDGVNSVQYHLLSALPRQSVFWIEVVVPEDIIVSKWRATALRSMDTPTDASWVVLLILYLVLVILIVLATLCCTCQLADSEYHVRPLMEYDVNRIMR